MIEKRRANCHYCGYLCAFTATVEDGRVIDLEPDPTRYPYDARILAGCRRWRMNLDMIDAPDRINYPLRRVGERGGNGWERITWGEALDDIAARLAALAEEHGPETLASMIGGPHTSFWPLHRFMNLFGSPNNMGIGQICWNPRIWMDVVTFGWTVEADLNFELTKCVVIWGTNPAESDNSAFWQALRAVGKSDIPLIVVDPRYTQVASCADLWLPVRPATDIPLALAMLNVIIGEGLVDRAFVDEWCYGYDELADHVRAYDPDTVSQECGVPADDIRTAARLFASGPSVLVSGRGIDQVGRNVAPAHRAICCLRAVTGNVDRPGACVIAEASDFVPEFDLEMTDSLAPEHRARCLNTPHTPLQCYDGFEYMRTLTQKHGRTLPGRYLSSAHPDLVLRAMETGDPYPVRALIVEATNPLLTYADTHRVFNALMSLDLIVVIDYHLTSTAQIADFVLPAAGAIERSTFQAHGGVANIAYGGGKAVDPYYERRCDYDFFRGLGLRLGQEAAWPDETFEDALRTTLAPCGMTFEQYCETGIYAGHAAYGKHLLPLPGDETGTPRGFATTTGKIELASVALEHLGGSRLPSPAPHLSLCSGDTLAKGAHLTLITGSRKQPYNASMYFNNPAFRAKSPYPVAEMSPATAERLGLAEGDTVVLATDNGQARFRLETRLMVDDVVNADYGWWHPEADPGLPDVGGIWDSNINCLTSCSVADGEEMIGTWSYNAIDCVVFKTDEPLGFSPDDLETKECVAPRPARANAE